MAMSGTASENEQYNEWKRVVQRVTTNDNVVILANFPFFRITEEPTNKHPKEDRLNLVEGLDKGLLNQVHETSPK